MSKLQEIGLENWLSATKNIHNGKGYADLLAYLKAGDPIAFIARQFSVSRPTIYEWIEQLPAKDAKLLVALREAKNA